MGRWGQNQAEGLAAETVEQGESRRCLGAVSSSFPSWKGVFKGRGVSQARIAFAPDLQERERR